MIRRMITLLACLVFLLGLLPVSAPAESSPSSASADDHVILVGWYESPFNRTENKRLSGYAYEYQQKIAAYTGWKYDYIKGSWSELLEMLIAGDIDLMSDVSMSDERIGQIQYADIPMGSEIYYLYVSPDNAEITADNYASLDGKIIGVTANSVQKGMFMDWAAKNGIRISWVEPDQAVPAGESQPAGAGITVTLQGVTCSEEDSLNMLKAGSLDGFITLDTYEDPDLAVPVWKIGSSDFYFAVSNRRADELLGPLNDAMNRIQDENKFYSEELSAKYLRTSGSNRHLTPSEKEWLETHGPIRVGYQDNYLAFCASDPASGELTGALKDYLAYAADTLENTHLAFEAIAYPTADAVLKALQSGEIDCMFPANYTAYDGEREGIVMSPAIMRTEMDAVVRKEDKADFLRKTQTQVAVNQGNSNYEIFLLEHFPGWTPVRYKDTPACLDAVAAKEADCIIISNYRYGSIARQCERLNLTTVYTGVEMDYSFAVKEGNTVLYSILAKAIGLVPESTVSAALNYYSSTGVKTTLWDFLEDHLVIILAAVSVILLVVIILLWRRLRRHNRPSESHAV